MQFAFPFQVDRNGRSEQASDSDHIRQMIEQVLFTIPGERVNRPTFGTGLNQLVFAPLSEELVTATQILVQSALQMWLGDLITVRSVEVLTQESQLLVTVKYTVRSTGQARMEKFNRVQ